jgi:uncharacterized protein
MARPIKCRRISNLPGTTYFKPAGIPVRDLEEICLSLEELEAVKLKDLEGLEQERGADSMQISRPTFQRILASAHQKIADALLNGKALRINGGNIQIAPLYFRCARGHEWSIPYETALEQRPVNCPECKSPEISEIDTGRSICRRTGKRKCCERDNAGIDNNL